MCFSQDWYYLVVENMERGTLLDHIADTRLSWTQKYKLMYDVSTVLQHALVLDVQGDMLAMAPQFFLVCLLLCFLLVTAC